MATNSYFNNFKRHSEQSLLESLIIESIKIYGYDFIYIPRQSRKLDPIYGEDVLSKFDQHFEIEMYIKSVDNYTGDGEFLSKFGLEIRERAQLVVAIKRFNDVIADTQPRPNEGDLIYFEKDEKLLEVKFVEDKSVFFQLGQLYVYELTVEAYQFSHEKFDTGILDIDKISDTYQSSLLLNIDNITGTFNKEDVIYQGPSLIAATAKAIVTGFDIDDSTLILQEITGQFVNGPINGPLGTAEITNLDELIKQTETDNNKNFETESNQVIEFSEKNPFSEDV